MGGAGSRFEDGKDGGQVAGILGRGVGRVDSGAEGVGAFCVGVSGW